MTVDDYWAAVKALGLTPTIVPTVYVDAEKMTHNVPEPAPLPDAVRLGIIRRLRESMGIANGS